MKLKDKIKSYSFWISLGSAVILIMKLIGAKFGFDVDSGFASDLLTSLCSILVILGIIVTPTSKAATDSSTESDTCVKSEKTKLETQEIFENKNISCEQTYEIKEITDEQNSIAETTSENLSQSEKECDTQNTLVETENPIETFKEELLNQNIQTFNGKTIPTSEIELNEFFEREKEKFKLDLDDYIELLKQEILTNNQKSE